MKLTGTKLLISFIFTILLSSFVSSLDFQFLSPAQVNENESFDASIIANTSDIYDVKIFVTNDSKEFSEIYDGSAWKSTHYYLKSVFPQTSVFQLKAHSAGDTVICSRLRKTGASSYTEVCNNIKVNQVIQTESQSGSSNSSNTNSVSNQTAGANSSAANSSQNNVIISNSSKAKKDSREQSSQTNSQAESSQQSSSNRIILNSQAIKESSSTFTTSDGKIWTWITYSFTIICVLIIIFLVLKKL